MNESQSLSLNKAGVFSLIEKLGDTPETVIPTHQLRVGLARAYLVGKVDDFKIVVIQSQHGPEEPLAFGVDIGALGSVLKNLRGWTCVDVETKIAHQVGSYLKQDLQTPVRYLRDLYFILDKPPKRFEHEAVRLLTIEDLPLLKATPKELQSAGFKTSKELLTNGIVAGAIIDRKLISITHASAFSKKYADIGTYTDPSYRNRGLSTATTYLVVTEVQRRNKIPTWSVGENNLASLKVAQKIGFRKYSERTYVIVDK